MTNWMASVSAFVQVGPATTLSDTDWVDLSADTPSDRFPFSVSKRLARKPARFSLLLTRGGTRLRRRRPRRHRIAAVLVGSCRLSGSETIDHEAPHAGREHAIPKQGLEASPRPSPGHCEPCNRVKPPPRDCEEGWPNCQSRKSRTVGNVCLGYRGGDCARRTRWMGRTSQTRGGHGIGFCPILSWLPSGMQQQTMISDVSLSC